MNKKILFYSTKKAFACLAIMFVLLSCIMPMHSVSGEEASPRPEGVTLEGMENIDEINIVLLLDNTGSMNENDSQRVSISAAKNFVEYLARTMRIGEKFGYIVPKTNVGVFTFSDSATEVCGLTDISSDANVKGVISRIDEIRYVNHGTGATYYGPGLRAAYGALPTSKPRCKNIVFMFTDGKPQGKNADSQQNSPRSAIENLSDYDVEVMIVGLDVNQSIGSEAKSLIYWMANKTQRTEGIKERPNSDTTDYSFEKANYFIATELNEDLSDFLMDIITKKIGIDIRHYSGIINVQKKEIIVVNIFSTSDNVEGLTSLRLRYGDRDIDMTETDDFYHSTFSDNSFTVSYSERSAYITMYAPLLGDYYIDLPIGYDYRAYYLIIPIPESDYSISVNARIDEQNPAVCNYSIDAAVSVGGIRQPDDGWLADYIDVTVTGETEINTNYIRSSGFEFNSGNERYEGSFDVGLPGKYFITASVVDRYSDEVLTANAEVEFAAEAISTEDVEIQLVKGDMKKLRFPTAYWTNWPGIEYSVEIASLDPKIVAIKDDQGNFVNSRILSGGDGVAEISAAGVGETKIVETITDNFGNKYEINYLVKCSRNWIPFIICGAAVLLLLVIGAGAYMLLNESIRGSFTVRKDGKDYSERPPRGHWVSAWKIVEKVGIESDSFQDDNDTVELLKKTKIVIKTITRTDDEGRTVKQKSYFIGNENLDGASTVIGSVEIKFDRD